MRPKAEWAIDSEQVPGAQPNKVGVIFDYPAICKFNLSKSRSVEPVLTDLIISSTFSFYDFLSFHHPQQ